MSRSAPALQRMVRHAQHPSWVTFDESTKLYDASVQRQLKYLRAHSKSTKQLVSFDSDKCKGCILFIEPRKHAATEFVLRNWVHFLARLGWGLMVCHGSDNEAEVKKICEGWSSVTFYKLPKDDLPNIEYNKLMTAPFFWERVPHETVLLVQTDTMCLSSKGFDGEFLEYDYVGAPWHQTCPISGKPFRPGTVYKPEYLLDGQARCELWPHMVGNGGCSLRKRSAMLAICRKY